MICYDTVKTNAELMKVVLRWLLQEGQHLVAIMDQLSSDNEESDGDVGRACRPVPRRRRKLRCRKVRTRQRLLLRSILWQYEQLQVVQW